MTATYTLEEIGTAADYAMTKAVCKYIRERLTLIPEALDKMVNEANCDNINAANKHIQHIVAIVSRLDGYLEGVEEGLK